jgi:3-dehydroquinate dehydratase
MEKHFIAQPHNEVESKKESVIPPEWNKLDGKKDGEEAAFNPEDVLGTLAAMEEMNLWQADKIKDLEIQIEKTAKNEKDFDDSISSKAITGSDYTKYVTPDDEIASLPARMSMLDRFKKKLAELRAQKEELADLIEKREHEIEVIEMTMVKKGVKPYMFSDN